MKPVVFCVSNNSVTASAVITESVYGVLQHKIMFPMGEKSSDMEVLLQSDDGRVLR